MIKKWFWLFVCIGLFVEDEFFVFIVGVIVKLNIDDVVGGNFFTYLFKMVVECIYVCF